MVVVFVKMVASSSPSAVGWGRPNRLGDGKLDGKYAKVKPCRIEKDLAEVEQKTTWNPSCGIEVGNEIPTEPY